MSNESNDVGSGENKRRRPSISRGRRSLTPLSFVDVEDEEVEEPQEVKSGLMVAYEKYKAELDKESATWKRFLTTAEQNVDSARRALEEPIVKEECTIDLSMQNFLNGRPAYRQYVKHADRYKLVNASLMSHTVERANILADFVEAGEASIRKKTETDVLRILEKQRPVMEIFSDLMSLHK